MKTIGAYLSKRRVVAPPVLTRLDIIIMVFEKLLRNIPKSICVDYALAPCLIGDTTNNFENFFMFGSSRVRVGVFLDKVPANKERNVKVSKCKSLT